MRSPWRQRPTGKRGADAEATQQLLAAHRELLDVILSERQVAVEEAKTAIVADLLKNFIRWSFERGPNIRLEGFTHDEMRVYAETHHHVVRVTSGWYPDAFKIALRLLSPIGRER